MHSLQSTRHHTYECAFSPLDALGTNTKQRVKLPHNSAQAWLVSQSTPYTHKMCPFHLKSVLHQQGKSCSLTMGKHWGCTCNLCVVMCTASDFKEKCVSVVMMTRLCSASIALTFGLTRVLCCDLATRAAAHVRRS
jgi:hypothetical protein